MSLSGTRETLYVEDPRGPFRDAAGRRYRIERRAGETGGFSPDNTGGHGYVQVDVVARSDTHAILAYRYLVMDDANGPPVLTYLGGGKVDLATGNGLWAAPQELAGLRDSDMMKVLRGPYTVGGRAFDAVVLAGGEMARVYDVSSGLLLAERIMGQSQRGWVRRNHVYTPAPPRTRSALMLFAGRRALHLPWADGRMPPWARTTRTLHYRGGQTIEMPGSGRMEIPSKSTIRLTEAGDDYTLHEGHWEQPAFGTLPAQEGRIQYATGPAVVGGFWIDPTKVQRLRAGQRLDSDPLIGSELTVARVGVLPSARPFLVIAERAPRYVVEWTYDRRSGMLLGSRLIHATPLQTTTTWIELVGAK